MPAKKKTQKKVPLTFRPGWNGKAYRKGSDQTIANTLIPSRPLTGAEMETQAKAIKNLAKAKGKKATIKREKGKITVSFK